MFGQNFAEELGIWDWGGIGNGAVWDKNMSDDDIQPNYLYRYPVPKVEGACTLNVKIHIDYSAGLDINLLGIQEFVDGIFNPKGIYFNYDYNYYPTWNNWFPQAVKENVNSLATQSSLSNSTIDILMYDGSAFWQDQSPGGISPGQQIFTYVPTIPSNHFGVTYLTPAPPNTHFNSNRNALAYGLGLALGLLPTVGVGGNNSPSSTKALTATNGKEIICNNNQIGNDFICETNNTSARDLNFDVDEQECLVYSLSNTTLPTDMTPSIYNIMSDIDFYTTCRREITKEQGRKIRYNVVNDTRLFDCLTTNSTMVFGGYINIPVHRYSPIGNETWAFPSVFSDLQIEGNTSLTISSLAEISPASIKREIEVSYVARNGKQVLATKLVDESTIQQKTITVKDYGTLQFNNATVTKYEPFDFPWHMIELIGNRNLPQTAANQPKVIFNNTNVSHAQEVVYPAQNVPNGGGFAWNTTGGYVQAENTVFKNNRRVTGFLSYENRDNGVLSNNISFFKECDFITDQDYLFESPPAQLSFWQVDKVKIQGCNFINNIPRVDDQYAGYAIHSIQASFDVETFGGAPCTFSGYEYAVKSELLRNALQTISVKNATFEDNLHGAFFKNVDLNVFVGNTVKVPSLPDNYPNFIVGDHNGAYGYYNLGGTGFAVENNNFEQIMSSTTLFQQPFGVIISNSGPDKNTVRRNTFINFNTGIEAIGYNKDYSNAGQSNQFGLQMLCNDFSGGDYDIYVPPTITNPDFPQIISDVAHYQGGDVNKGDLPAGNLFSHATNTIMDFENNGSGNVMYFHHDPTSNARVLPRNGYTVGVINNNQPISFNPLTDCPSSFKTNPGNIWNELSSAAQEYFDLKDLYNSILDQGSTPALLAQIYAAPASDYFQLYVDLMMEPGTLSHEVVMDLVQNPAFPNILLRNLVIANPHLLQDDGFWTALEDRSPAFSQTMLDEMWSGLANVSDLQLLFAQMGAALTALTVESNHALRSIGDTPENWAQLADTIKMICNLMPNAYYRLLGHLHQSNMNANYALEDSLQLLLTSGVINDVNLDYFEELVAIYNGYYGALNSVEPYSVALTPHVDDLEDIMLNSPSLSLRALASAVLMQEGHLNFPEVSENLVASSHFDIVVYPGAVSNKKARKAIPEKVQQYGSLSAYPNPTVGNTNLDYQFAQNPEEITIQVLTMDGRLVMQNNVKTNQPFGSLPLALNNLGTGFYIVTLSSKTGEVVQTKLVKQ